MTAIAEKQASPVYAESTLPRLLQARAAVAGARTAMREKQRGIWREWSWHEYLEQATDLAIGLQARGFERGDRLLVIGDNRPRLYMAMGAAQMLGGVILPVSAETQGSALQLLVRAQAVRFAVCDEAAQCARLTRIRAEAGGLTALLLDRARDQQVADDVVLLDHLIAQARQSGPAERDRVVHAAMAVDPSDLAAILAFPRISLGSPSEAWAEPQAVSQSHEQAVALARAQVAQYALTDRDQLLAYMPVGSRADHHFSCVLALAAGLTLNFPESTDTAQNDMREIGPSLHVLPDWALAQLMRAVLRRAKEANVVSAYLFDRYMGKPRAVAAAPGPLGRLLFHRPLRDVLGMGRTRLLFVDGRQADPAAVAFFESLGLRLAYLDDWAVTASGGICASGASLPSATSACR
jgi:long-chain acyl-CoA synthetase